jgi:hypothetical protein
VSERTTPAQPIAAADRELIQQLLDDAAILGDLFLVGIPKPAATRTICVPILRRWIVEGLFHQAQKLISPAQVSFSIYSNGRAVQLCKAGVYAHDSPHF